MESLLPAGEGQDEGDISAVNLRFPSPRSRRAARKSCAPVQGCECPLDIRDSPASPPGGRGGFVPMFMMFILLGALTDPTGK